MKFTNKIKDMSIPGAIITSGLVVGFSIFFTTWIFFGGDNNRQKLSTPTSYNAARPQQANTLTPQQIQQLQMAQQQRMMTASTTYTGPQNGTTTRPVTFPAPTLKPKTTTTIKK